MSQLLEEAHGHLQGYVVRTEEDASDEWEAHPPLAHDSVSGLQLALDGHPFIGSQSTNADAPELLDLLDAHHLEDLLRVLMIVTVANLDALDGIFSMPIPIIINFALLAVVLQLLIHLI